MNKSYKIKFTDEKYNRPTEHRKEKVRKLVNCFNDYILECIGEDAATIDSVYVSINIETVNKKE